MLKADFHKIWLQREKGADTSYVPVRAVKKGLLSTIFQLYFFEYSFHCRHHFSGPERLVCRLCVSFRVWATTFGLNDRSRRYLMRWFILFPSRSSSKVKVIGQSSWSQDENDFFSTMDAHLGLYFYG